MTYQYLTIGMMEKAKENGGFVDQTEFKTAQQYTFDSLIFDETSTRIIDDYIMHIRPLLNPQCDYVLVTRNGMQIKNFYSSYVRDRLCSHWEICSPDKISANIEN